jgi:hypothetical protein
VPKHFNDDQTRTLFQGKYDDEKRTEGVEGNHLTIYKSNHKSLTDH